MRSKELAHDYRYFPEPDLQPVFLNQEYIEKVRQTLPPLPDELYEKFTKSYGLSDYDASNLTDNKEIALFFEEVVTVTKNYKAASNQIMGPVKSYLNAQGISILKYPLSSDMIAEIIELIESGRISNSAAVQKLYPLLYKNPGAGAAELAEKHDLLHSSDESEIEKLVRDVIARWPEKAIAYKNGKKNLLGLFMGEVMKASRGKADPKLANRLIRKILEE